MDPVFELSLIGPFLVRIATPQKWQQCHGRGRTAIPGMTRGAMRALALATRAFRQIKRPAAVWELVLDKPFERRFYRCFALRVAAARLHEALPLSTRAASQPAALASHHADSRQEIARCGRLGAKVCELD